MSTPARQPASSGGKQTETLVDRIKAAKPILDYLSQFTQLKTTPGADGNYFGKCINSAHQDGTPSFYVKPSLGCYQCKGCGITSNVITAYAMMNNLAYEDAKFELGRQLGVVRERSVDSAESLLSKHQSRYQWQLERMRDAQEYLLGERKLLPETLKTFGVGFCWGTEFKDADAPTLKLGVEAGLLPPPDPERPRAEPRSAMAMRITFPIRDRAGRLCGFSGRQLPPPPGGEPRKGPKYRNTGETKYFHKSELLYGLYEIGRAHV